MIMLSAVLLILFSIFTFAFLSQPKIKGVIVLFCFQIHITNGIALSLVLAFRARPAGGSSSIQTGSNNSSKKDTVSVSKYTSKAESEIMELEERRSQASTEPATSIEPVPSNEPTLISMVNVQEVEEQNSHT